MRILPWKIISTVGLLALCTLLSACSTACPPACLGERLGALDWNGRNMPGARMINTSARQANLANVNFNGADLTGFDLTGANLGGIHLKDAVLIGANLEKTYLSGATFNHTDLTAANLAGADLTGAELNTSRLTAAEFVKTRLVNANLSQLDLAGATMSGSQITSGNLNRVNLAGGVLDKIELSGADLRYADLRGAWINLSSLVGANLRGADLAGASLVGSDLSGCNFQLASLAGANLVGANLRGADLRGADLRGAQLIATPELLDRQNMPDSIFMEMSAAQWEQLALGDALLDGAKYDSATRWPLEFEPPASLVYLPAETVQLGAFPGVPGQNLLRVAGSQTVLPLAKALAQVYTVQHPDMFLALSGSDSADGIRQVGSGLADIGMSSRRLNLDERSRYASLATIPIALDSILVVVNLGNPVSDLSIEQLRAIFSGEITNWAELGGADLPIDLLIRKDSMADVFSSIVMGDASVAEAEAQVLPSIAAMRATVASDPAAIGLMPNYFQDGSLKSLSISQVLATPATITSGQYPLVRPYYLVGAGVPAGEYKDWLDFIFSAEGRQIILLAGLEPVQDER